MGYTALQSGLAVSPRGLGALLTMPVVGYLTGVMDKAQVIGTGFLLFGASSLLARGHQPADRHAQHRLADRPEGGRSALIFVPLSAVAMGTLRREGWETPAGSST